MAGDFFKNQKFFFFYSWIKTYYTPAIFCIKDTDQVEFYMSFLFINTSVDSEWPTVIRTGTSPKDLSSSYW